MKKILSLFLVICIGLTLAGFYPVFVALQHQTRQAIKHRIKLGVPEKDIHKFTFAENEKINWVRPEKEFRLNNEMYDIVKQESRDGKTIFYCINDKEEKALFTLLDDLVKQQMNDGNSPKGKTTHLLMKLFSQPYISPELIPIIPHQSITQLYFEHQFSVQQLFAGLDTPPPELV